VERLQPYNTPLKTLETMSDAELKIMKEKLDYFKEGGKCFPGNAKLTLTNGTTIQMKEIDRPISVKSWRRNQKA